MSIVCAAALVSLTACTSSDDDVKQSKQTITTPSDEGSETVTSSPSASQPSVQTPPELDNDEILAGRQKVTTGNANIAYQAGKKDDALIVAVRCEGGGKIKVSVQPVHVSFPLDCPTKEVSTTYNQVAVTGVERSGVVSVEAASGVRWSLTVGRGAPAQMESSSVE
ncbi:hypothetical protein ABZT17_41030 [Streptomyces sp. NPDC005648]|uniref:hypothetical protein n=1 Tax=Streptomyces sp. NPDC005648 TaxID=3157044 RepID=UPI0033AF26FC